MQNQGWDTIGQFKVSKNLFLGKGQSCLVYYGFNQKNGQKVAVKKIDLSKINERLKKQLQNQINNLKHLTSPFIVRLHGCKTHQNYLYLFLQYCEDLDLKRYLDRHKKKSGLCEVETLMFIRYIIQGYKELYKHNIIHRDIKPANILLKQGIAKLSDFGFSRVVPNPQASEKFTLLGTPLYTAPQILLGQQFSSKCDVWSVGIVFYQMLYARTPWTGQTLTQLKEAIFSKPLQFGQIKRKEGIKKLIQRMLKINTKQRISWKQIFENQLFKDQIPKNILNQAKGYNQYKDIFLEYVKNNIVKSYLRFNMEQIDFKQSFQPTDEKINIIQKIQKQISHKRNIAFMYAYMLILYYKNITFLPQTINIFMQFQYSLAMKAFATVAHLGTMYFHKNPPNYQAETWKTFKDSSSYEELKKVLMNDYKILQKMCQQIKFQADKRYKEGKLNQDAVKWFNYIDQTPDKGYGQAIKLNHKLLSKVSSKGVCGLLSYFMEYTSNKKALQDNDMLDFGSFYEKKQRDYGLS